jgi:hypothetical protein
VFITPIHRGDGGAPVLDDHGTTFKDLQPGDNPRAVEMDSELYVAAHGNPTDDYEALYDDETATESATVRGSVELDSELYVVDQKKSTGDYDEPTGDFYEPATLQQ